jgi:hypothetical protein
MFTETCKNDYRVIAIPTTFSFIPFPATSIYQSDTTPPSQTAYCHHHGIHSDDYKRTYHDSLTYNYQPHSLPFESTLPSTPSCTLTATFLHLQSPNPPMIKKLRQPIVIELGDDNKVTLSHHGLINVSQKYKSMLSTPLHSGSLFSPSIIWTQLDTHLHLDAISAPYHLHQSPSKAISTNSVYEVHFKKEQEEERKSIIEHTFHQKEYHQAHISPYHQSRTPPSLVQAHPTLPLQVQPATYLNVHLPPNFRSPLGSLAQSQNHDRGITIYLTFILLPYDLSLMDHQSQYQVHYKAI